MKFGIAKNTEEVLALNVRDQPPQIFLIDKKIKHVVFVHNMAPIVGLYVGKHRSPKGSHRYDFVELLKPRPIYVFVPSGVGLIEFFSGNKPRLHFSRLPFLFPIPFTSCASSRPACGSPADTRADTDTWLPALHQYLRRAQACRRNALRHRRTNMHEEKLCRSRPRAAYIPEFRNCARSNRSAVRPPCRPDSCPLLHGNRCARDTALPDSQSFANAKFRPHGPPTF